MDRVGARLARNPVATAAGLVVSATIGLFVVWPFLRITAQAFEPGAVQQLWASDRMRRVVGFTVVQAAFSTVCTFCLGLPGAWLLGTRRVAGKRLLEAFWSAPFTLPAVVMGSAVLSLLPERWERSTAAIVLAHTCFNCGMVARTVGAAWQEMDQRFEEVAATLGHGPLRRNLLAIRMLRAQIISSGGLVFSLCLTSYAIISILGGPTRSSIETEIHRLTFQLLRLDRAAVLALLQTILVGFVLYVSARPSPTPAAISPRVMQRSSPLVAIPIICALSITAVLPVAALLLAATDSGTGARTLRAFSGLFRTIEGSGLANAPANSFLTSLRAALGASAIAVCLAVAATVARYSSLPFVAWAAEKLSALPLAVSGVTLGLGTLLAFAKTPMAWRDDAWMVPVVQAIVALPFAVRILAPAWKAIDPRLRDAAATLGVSPRKVIWRVDLPLLRRSIAVSAGITFAVALGEFGASSFLVRPRRETMPVAIGMLSSRPGAAIHATAAALALVLAICTSLVTIISALSARRTIGVSK